MGYRPTKAQTKPATTFISRYRLMLSEARPTGLEPATTGSTVRLRGFAQRRPDRLKRHKNGLLCRISSSGKYLNVAQRSLVTEAPLRRPAEPDAIPDRPAWMTDIQYSEYWGYCFRAQKAGEDVPTPEQWRNLTSPEESVP